MAEQCNLQLLSELIQGHIIRNDYNHFVNSTGTCPSGAPVFRVARSLVSIVVLYRPLFVFLPFFIWPLYCLSLFQLHCALNLISAFVFLSLGRYIYVWTISPWRYHPLSSQCLDTYIVFKYIYYLNLQFLNKEFSSKLKVLLSQAWVTLSDFGYLYNRPFGYTAP
jgi:hypothetical protein